MEACFNLTAGVFFGGNLESGTFHVAVDVPSPGELLAGPEAALNRSGVACVPPAESADAPQERPLAAASAHGPGTIIRPLRDRIPIPEELRGCLFH